MLFNRNGSDQLTSDKILTITHGKIRIPALGPGRTEGKVANIKFLFSIDEEEYKVDLSHTVEVAHRLKVDIGIPATP